MRYLRIGVALLVVGYLLTGVTQVRPGERAVVRRFGAVLGQKPEPGLWIGLPWGLERVDRVAVDLLHPVDIGYRPNEDDGETTPPGQLVAGDHNLVNVRIIVNYRVRPEQVEDYVAQLDAGEPASIDRLVEQAAESLLAEWVASRGVDDVLLQGKANLPRWLVERPERHLERRLEPYRLGIEIAGATVTYLAPPNEVKEAFDRVTEAQSGIRTRTDAAEARARELLRQTESESFNIIQMAHAYAQEQQLQARAEASTFEKRLHQYRQARQENPAALASIWWDQMGELFKRMKANGRLDLLDHHLGGDGLNLMQIVPRPEGKEGPKFPSSPGSR
jgi:membrane protease subunit HflK